MTTATTTTTTSTRSRKRAATPTPAPVVFVAPPALKVMLVQEQLKQALGMLLPAVAGKSTLPILMNVLIASDGPNRVRMAATNLEIAITVWIGARVEREGAITLPAKLLSDIVAGLPNETIAFDIDARTETAHLTCRRFEANIKGIEADEFPFIPTLAGERPAATFAPDTLRRAIGQVALAAATDDTRPILAGVRIAFREKVAAFTAADGFRIAFRDVALDEPVVEAREVVIPARALETLGKVLSGVDGDVELIVGAEGNQVLFRSTGLELVSRVIDGVYPDTSRYAAQVFSSVLEIETRALARAVKLASFFAAASSNIIRLELAPGADGAGTLMLSANAAEVGDNHSVHETTLRGPGGKAALNVAFLADGIAAVGSPTIAIHYNNPEQPVVLRGVGDETYTYLAMPMTVR